MPLGDIRTFNGSNGYHDSGYDGQPSSGNELLLGVLESYGFQDEACFLGDASCDPSSRTRARFNCTGSGCTATSNFTDEQAHGTIVTSIAIGDYSQDQADGHDSAIASGLSSWEFPATGYAREAELHYYAAGTESGKVKGYACAHGIGTNCVTVDVLNASNGDTVGACDAASWHVLEDALEDAWDDGVLPVTITHNDGVGMDVCEVRSPADIPKAFAVGAVDPDDSSSHASWTFSDYSNRGGGMSKIGFAEFSTSMSMVDLVAPGRPGHVTTEDGTYGEVSVDGPQSTGNVSEEGTSYAAPQVAGAALQVKHRMLDLGLDWIDDPGRLHTVMLSMGDRATAGNGANGATSPACISGGRLRCGADRQYGLGRLRLRLHDLMWMRTNTFTSSSQVHKEIVFGGAIPSGKVILKCVTQQREDMNDADKDDISGVTLSVQVRAKSDGECVVDAGSLIRTITDNEPDDKHMVVVLDAEHNIEGNCMQLIVDPTVISSAGSVVTHTYCQADNNLDY